MSKATDGLRASLDLPACARLVLCGEPAGQLTPAAGVRDALWAADILKYLYDDLYLLVLGDGPDVGALKQFARDIGVADRVRFLGCRQDWREILAVADLVWAPVQNDALPWLVAEARAAGRLVIASSRPRLAAVIRHGEDGFLIPPSDKASLARLSLTWLGLPQGGNGPSIKSVAAARPVPS